MFKRLLILTLLQLSNKMRLDFYNNKRFLAGVGLRLLAIALISVALAFVLYAIHNILYIPVNAYFMIFVLLIIQGFSIIAATNGLINDLYKSKENQILLAFPVQMDEVFISKLLVFYINEFIKNLYFTIPLLIGFGFVNSMPFWYYLNILPMVFILPMIAVLVAALFSIPFVYIKNQLAGRNVISFVVVLCLLLFAFAFVVIGIGQIAPPIRIIQLYNSFRYSIIMFMVSSADYALIYFVIGMLLYGVNLWLNYAIVLGTLLGLLALVVLILRPLYFQIASRTIEHAVQKKHLKPNKRETSLFKTFLRKELIIARRNINHLLSDYIILLSLPFFLYVLNYVYMAMNRNTTGNMLVIVFNIIIALLLVTSSNTASASAVTSEGWEFILLKTAPSDTKVMAWAKITFNLGFSAVMILVSLLSILIVPGFMQWVLTVLNLGITFHIPVMGFKILDVVLLYFLVITINFGHILWSFQLDLLNPKLSDYAATGSLSSHSNASQSIGNGFIISMFFGLIAAALFALFKDYAWMILFALALPFLVFRLYYFNSYLKAYFIDIEF